MNTESYQQWIGREQFAEQYLTDAPVRAMLATLGNFAAALGDNREIPPLWHWLYFLETAPWEELANDGHQKRGEFLPPVDLPRRMWAGSELQFHRPLKIGVTGRRRSVVDSIESKQGRSGKLVFVKVLHEIFSQDELAITETQNIVYRDAPTQSTAAAATLAPGQASFSETISPDTLLLFRYSALTFNAHRIHYDRPYAVETEAYPGLVVHGPLMATLLVNLLGKQYPDRQLEQFAFRAQKPVFDLAPFQVCGNAPDESGKAELWIADTDQAQCMQATAVLES